MDARTVGDAVSASTISGVTPAQRRSIVLLATAAFASSATTRITDPVLPQLAQEFAVSIAAVSFVATGYTLAYGVFQAFFGPLGDRFGKFRTVLWLCIACAATTLICSFATSLNQIAAARFASGLTAAAIIPLSIAWIGDSIDYAQRQPILAHFTSGQIAGILAGQIAGGAIGEYFGWRASFYFLSAIYVVVAIGLAREVTASPSLRDPAGAATPGWLRSWSAMARLLLRPRVRIVLLACSLESFAVFGALTYVSVHLRRRFDLDYASVGLYLGAFAGGGFLYVLFARRLIERLGQAGLAWAGAALAACGFLAVGFTPAVWLCAPAIAALGLGFYMMHNTLQMNATQMSPEARGSGIALFATFFFVSQSIGVTLGGAAVDRFGAPALFVVASALTMAAGAFMALRLAENAPA
jgi:predicted MFS family arabinose efflux permease